MIKRIVCTATTVLLLLTVCGCSFEEEPLRAEDVVAELVQMQSSEQALTIRSNPMTKYEVSLNDELLQYMNIERWALCDEEDAKSGITAMLYFDIPHKAENVYSRVALLSNGYALIQLNENGDFTDSRWYDCNFDKVSDYKAFEEYVTTKNP